MKEKSAIIRNRGLLILAGALISGFIIVIVKLAIKNHQLEKQRQEFVEFQKEKIKKQKEKHNSEIENLMIAKYDLSQKLIKEREHASALEQELKIMERKIKENDEEINRMDSTALLYELESIRAAYQIY